MSVYLSFLFYGILAFIPAFIWLTFIFKKFADKKLQTIIFLCGIFSVIPLFLIEHLFNLYPAFDFVSKALQLTTNPHLQFVMIYMWVGISEEIIKQLIIRYIDNRYNIVRTINDSIQISLISALGFAFAENIFYFYNIGGNFGIPIFITTYFFRSIFTTCAHLVFSGFFGYYYGIAKFSIVIFEHLNWQGKKFWLYQLIGRKLNISRIQAFKEVTILKGLLIAVMLHLIYDYLLQLNNLTDLSIFIILSVLLVVLGYLILHNLLKNKAGQLILTEHNNQISTMAQSDEEVVIELLGMWFNEGKFVDVIHICERLLVRDPDNKVVQLFKAKALDKMGQDNPYKKVLANIFPNEITK